MASLRTISRRRTVERWSGFRRLTVPPPHEVNMLGRSMRAVLWLLAAAPLMAHAFCGFFVSSAGAQLFNDATMVVLMRDGTRTVLSMQNNYRGPPENFALVVPVPVVLTQKQVRTIPREAFTRIDELTSPRLVEMYTELCPMPKMAMRAKS